MFERELTSLLEPVEFLLQLRDAGYSLHPTETGVLACPPEGVTMAAELRLTLFRVEPFVRDLLVLEGQRVLSESEAAQVAARPGRAVVPSAHKRGSRQFVRPRRCVSRRIVPFPRSPRNGTSTAS